MSAESSPSPASGPAPLEELAPLLEPLRRQYKLPALGAALIGRTGLRALGVVGRRRVDQPEPAGADDRWHIGSNTKAMTATLVAALVERNEVAWTTSLAEAFPDLAGQMAESYRPVTLEMLLGHRGGAPVDFPADIWSELWKPGDSQQQRAWAVREILGRSAGEPGNFRYSNVGYVVVGAALERLTGRSWESLMAERLFAPLNMTSAGFGPPAASGSDQPWGHVAGWFGAVRPVKPLPKGDNPPPFGPAGRVHCSLRDWCRFLTAHLDGGRGDKGLLDAASFAKLHTPEPGGEYALGWNVLNRKWAGGVALNHAGSNTTFFASAWLAPSREFGQVVVMNRGDSGAAHAADLVHQALIRQYLA